MGSNGIIAALVSAGAITLAEMGDKTQLLAMAFALGIELVNMRIRAKQAAPVALHDPREPVAPAPAP